MTYFPYEDIDEALCYLVTKLYCTPECEVGGPLHIVLDDMNDSDNNIIWCLDHCRDESYVTDEIAGLCYQIGGILLTIPERDRCGFIDHAWDIANRVREMLNPMKYSVEGVTINAT